MVSRLEQQVRSFCMQQGEGVSSRGVAIRCSKKLGISYKTAEAYVYAFVNGYGSHTEYQEAMVTERGFDSLTDYNESLAIRKGFRSFRTMQNAWARRGGFGSIRVYKRIRKNVRRQISDRAVASR